MLLGELLDRACSANGEETAALGDGRTRLGWGEYRDLAARLAFRLRAAGVKPGDRVAVHLPKSVDSFVAVHATLRAGGVVVPLDWFAPVPYLRGVIADASPVVLVTAARTATADELVAGTAVSEVLDATGSDGEALDPVTVQTSDPAYIIYTSGSTGQPKGIVHTHASALRYAELAAETYALSAKDRLANIAPLQFDQSTFELYAAPLAGAAVLVVPDAVMRFPASLAELIAHEAITVWYSVPYALRQLCDRGATERYDLSSLRWILFGGETYPPEELAALMRAIPSARVSNVYGPAEVNQCTFYHLEEPPPPALPVPIGQAWSGARIELLDEGAIVQGIGDGELWVATETMMERYWNRPDLTDAAVVEDHPVLGSGRWYRTGDLAQRTDDGELVFLGRVDNQIKVRGYRIELEAVEAALVEAPGVDTCAAVIDGDGETIAAIVDPVLDDSALADLRALAASALPRHSVPTRIESIAALPRTSSGKVDRNAARLLLAEPTPGADSPVSG